MASPHHFLKASADVAETVRRNRRIIRQVADLCAGSERELDAAYDLLRKVRRSEDTTSAAKLVEGSHPA